MSPPLQPWILFGLPLILLPIIIHLINQYRHRTVKWAAMMFLLDAKRMNKGMARLKQILILAMRVIALAALIFAISRPLASGWFGVALGGSADTTIVLLDRSVSMEQKDSRTGETKRETALRKLSELLNNTGSTARLVLIENTELKARDLSSPRALLDLPAAGPSATKADIPSLIQAAIDFVTANESGRTDVWVLSDLRASDWDPKGGRWEALRAAAEELEGLRFNLLVYPEVAEDNISVSLTDVTRRVGRDQGELLLDVRLTRAAADPKPVTVPLEFVVNGARTQLEVELTENEMTLQGHSIRIDADSSARGWGAVELPNDSNVQDNAWYFVFSEPAERLTIIVSDDPRAAEPMRVAASAGAEQGLSYAAQIIEPDRVAEIEWDKAALILWHAPLPAPESVTARQLTNFVDQGRVVIFFPPDRPGENSLFGMKWGDWQKASAAAPAQISWWRPDSDLWKNTESGKALPVGQLEILRYCTISGEANPLARIEDNLPVLTRAPTDRGAAYFMGISPHPDHSTLSREGISFYVLLHRALAAGANGLSNAQQLDAGTNALSGEEWERLAPNDDSVLSSEQQLLAGAFESNGRLRALNRPIDEDRFGVVDELAVGEMMTGLEFQIIRDQAGGSDSLANEIWRAFVIAMGIALLVEAVLCLPSQKRRRSSGAQAQPALAT